MDDIFCVFDVEEQCAVFHGLLNELYSVLKFTCGKKNNMVLTFLDVPLHRSGSFFLTFVY